MAYDAGAGAFFMSKFNIVKEIKTKDFEEFREKLMEDLAQDLYENTGAEYSMNGL